MGIVSTFTFTSDTETVTRTKLNALCGNLVTEFNGSIDDANIAADAAISGSKLDLSSIGEIGSGTPAAGTFTTLSITGDTTIGDATGDSITFNADNWTLANATTVTGTWADLGTVTTIDINGGTIDGVTLGGASQVTITNADINGGTIDGVSVGNETATGMIYVNNASDQIDGLGSQGTTGQYLQSAGAGANPVWATLTEDLNRNSSTAVSTSANSGDITIAANKFYMVKYSLLQNVGAGNIQLRFNSDSGSADYGWYQSSVVMDDDSPARVESGDVAADSIKLGDGGTSGGNNNDGVLYIDTSSTGKNAFVTGTIIFHHSGYGYQTWTNICGYYSGGTVTSFEIFTNSETLTGNIYVYEYALS